MTAVIKIDTTGLPKSKGFNNYYEHTETDKYDSSRIVSFEYVKNGKFHKHIIKLSDGVPEIKNKHFHGIDGKMIKDKGVSIETVINPLLSCDSIVCFGSNFTINVLCSELYRIGRTDLIENIKNKRIICLMENLTDIMKIKLEHGGYKAPSAFEAYSFKCRKTCNHITAKELCEIYERM